MWSGSGLNPGSSLGTTNLITGEIKDVGAVMSGVGDTKADKLAEAERHDANAASSSSGTRLVEKAKAAWHRTVAGLHGEEGTHQERALARPDATASGPATTTFPGNAHHPIGAGAPVPVPPNVAPSNAARSGYAEQGPPVAGGGALSGRL
jgi:hypothetical protein